jgi:hypothetical protein
MNDMTETAALEIPIDVDPALHRILALLLKQHNASAIIRGLVAIGGYEALNDMPFSVRKKNRILDPIKRAAMRKALSDERSRAINAECQADLSQRKEEAPKRGEWWGVKRSGLLGNSKRSMYRHKTLENAQAEAEMLAALIPGAHYIVLHKISQHRVPAPEQERE